MKTLALIAFASFVMSAYAGPLEPILGIRLGQDLQGQFSECQGRRDNWCTLSSSPPGMLMPPDSDSPTGLPTWVKRERLVLEPNKDGKVDRFYVTTLGPQVQDRVVDSVSGRFGKPTHLDKQVAQTAMGVKFEAVSARWVTDDAVVVHACTRINACMLLFYTPEAYAREIERRKQALQRDKL